MRFEGVSELADISNPSEEAMIVDLASSSSEPLRERMLSSLVFFSRSFPSLERELDEEYDSLPTESTRGSLKLV